MNIDRTHEHEIDRWENEGGSFLCRAAYIADPIGVQQWSWTERKQQRHDGECRKKNQQLKQHAYF
ncbi:hypothetical protein Mal15_18420 [Stieleria maiorica]|uniref:Uncharacterized protein n=1 Tax=Stieleria maiorica TaxID=2795974 RepID=A0A5B9M9M3_9BACT|nr:hypothetical protein Mal15_18420 [Stieleria maiorica]